MSLDYYLHITACEEDVYHGAFQRPDDEELATANLIFPRARMAELLGSAMVEGISETTSFVLSVEDGKIVGVKHLEYMA